MALAGLQTSTVQATVTEANTNLSALPSVGHAFIKPAIDLESLVCLLPLIAQKGGRGGQAARPPLREHFQYAVACLDKDLQV